MPLGISINGNRKHISFYTLKGYDFSIDYKYSLKKVIYGTYYYVVAMGLEYELITGMEIILAYGCKETPVREIEVIKYMDILRDNWNWNLSLKVLNELKVYNTLMDKTKMVTLVDIMLPIIFDNEKQHYRKIFDCKFRDMYLVFERYGNDLSYILSSSSRKKQQPPLLEINNNIQQQQWLLSELLSAVSSLHSQKLIHRDLCPSNVCVSFEEKILKLKSFGLSSGFSSKVYLDDEEEETYDDEITPIYTAPEIILGKASSPLVDVWGVGCIFAEILRGGGGGGSKIGTIVTTLENKASLDKLSPSNPLAIDLLRRMLDFNPDTRISVEEAKQHAYFGGGGTELVGGSSSSSSSRGVVVALAEEEDMGVLVEVTVPEVVEPDAHALRKLIWKEMVTLEMMNKKKTSEIQIMRSETCFLES